MVTKLKIYAGSRQPEDNEPRPTGGISCLMTLTQFFEKWFLPIVLKAERESKPATVTAYRESLDWWNRFTGDPKIQDIDEFAIALFQEGLRTVTFRRGLFYGDKVHLSAQTQRKHLRNVKAILHRTGPTRDPSRQAKGLVAHTPSLRLPKVTSRPKPCFSWEQCRAIAAAAERMSLPSVPGVEPRDWWRSWLALFLYTGQRAGTLQALTWASVRRDEQGQHWLEIPASLVSKTEKETRVAMHSKLVEALQVTRQTSSPNELLIVNRNGYRWIQSLHERLQQLAGIPKEKWQSPHAWRRTHSDLLARRGLAAVTDICRRALDHSDARTTTAHYVDLANKFRLQLPDLW